jgi:glycosyltransferase involved in cell wall biosynthesis
VISVVIPAHNEATVIGRCLAALLDGSDPARVDILVVCNGCTDNTAMIARGAHTSVRVVETEVASKSAALNLGDASAIGFPRVYLDADVELRGSDLLRLAAALEAPDGPLVAAPALRVDSGGCSWAVRQYYEIWIRLPYVKGDWVGAGVYALSERARDRFVTFPDIVGDDFFISRLFDGPGEQQRVRDTNFVIHPPRTTRDLVRVLRRRRAAHHEYEEHFDHDARSHRSEGHRGALLELAREPRHWIQLVIYGSITVSGIVSGKWKSRFGDRGTWERDDSTRS